MNLFNNLFTDYKSKLAASQEENKRILDNLDDYKLQVKVLQSDNKRMTDSLEEYETKLKNSEDKNKKLTDEWEQYQHNKNEMNAYINLMKVLNEENKKLREELTELRRSFIKAKLSAYTPDSVSTN